MDLLCVIAELAAGMPRVTATQDLFDALAQACDRIGVRYFALSHHVDFAASPNAIRVHNYPEGWEDWYVSRKLGLTDPVHRASHRTATGFLWADIPRMIRLSPNDEALLARGREIGLSNGVTVPANVPGEARGSCTFVAGTGHALPDHTLLWAQALGMLAFEHARHLQRPATTPFPRLSERQRQCVALAGRGMSNPKIGRKLGIGAQTVMEHMREARGRIGVSTRMELVVSLLAIGDLCLDDIVSRRI